MSFEVPISIPNHTSKRMEKFNWGLRNSLSNRALGCHEKNTCRHRACEKSEKTASKIARGKNFPVKAGSFGRSPGRASIAARWLRTHFLIASRNGNASSSFNVDLICPFPRAIFYIARDEPSRGDARSIAFHKTSTRNERYASMEFVYNIARL